ncbi:MAG: hypothetical protein ACKO0V_17545, partial [bacterium]
RNFLELPDQSRTLAARYFELALIQLEGGQPKLAIEAFTKSLGREPESETSAVAKYYLEKLGKPFVEPAKPATEAAAPLFRPLHQPFRRHRQQAVRPRRPPNLERLTV